MKLRIKELMEGTVVKFSVLAMIMSFSVGSFAGEVLSLNELRSEVLSENLDIKIQYEKYYQAQKNVRNNLGEFLPNLSPQLLFWNTTYGILYAVSPNPTSWFQYRASNEFALAEKYVSKSIRLNILRDLTLSYVSIKHQEKVLSSMELQESNLVASYEEAQRKEELGLGDASVTFEKSRKLMQHRQEILLLRSAIAVQKKGLLEAVNRTPTDEITLDEIPVDIAQDIPFELEEGIEMGVNNSPELVANTFMAAGADYMSRGAKYSFISFSGIGFDYPARVAIERSKAKEIELKGQKIQNKIENQIALSYEQMEILEERIQIQNEIVANAEESLLRTTELHRGAQVTYEEVLKAEEAVFAEHRTLTKLKMEKMLQAVKTKRLLGMDTARDNSELATLTNEDVSMIVETSGNRRKKVSVYLDFNSQLSEDMREQIVSVVYGGDIFDYRISNHDGNFYLYTKTSSNGAKKVTATILFENGQKLDLETTIEL